MDAGCPVFKRAEKILGYTSISEITKGLQLASCDRRALFLYAFVRNPYFAKKTAHLPLNDFLRDSILFQPLFHLMRMARPPPPLVRWLRGVSHPYRSIEFIVICCFREKKCTVSGQDSSAEIGYTGCFLDACLYLLMTKNGKNLSEP